MYSDLQVRLSVLFRWPPLFSTSRSRGNCRTAKWVSVLWKTSDIGLLIARKSSLLSHPADAIEILETHAHLASLGPRLRIQYAGIRQLVDHARGATVSDAESPL